MSLVVDASVALDWCFQSERTAYANDVLDQVLRSGAIVPGLWPAEVANGLLMARRRKRIESAGVARALAMLQTLSIEVAPLERGAPMQNLVDLGERHSLTAYDAAYLALAMREGCALATLDQELRAAAVDAAVEVFGQRTA